MRCIGGNDSPSVMGEDECNQEENDISPSFTSWVSNAPGIAKLTYKKVQGLAEGSTTGLANGNVFISAGGYCAYDPEEEELPITVQVPTSLSVLSVTVLPNGQGLNFGCSGLANYGVKVDTKYQVLDQNGNAIASANMTPSEQGTDAGGQLYSGNIGPSGFTNSTLTAADGTFHDVPFGICANRAFSSATITQNISIVMPDGSTPAVRSQTFTLTGKTAGHGTISNGSDISATR